MAQRIRERLPHLPILVETAERYRAERAGLLAATAATLWRQVPPVSVRKHSSVPSRRRRRSYACSVCWRAGMFSAVSNAATVLLKTSRTASPTGLVRSSSEMISTPQ